MNPSLCSPARKKNLEKISSQSYDLIIIGGGITGAGIALDAVTRGLKTLLLEKQDYGSGTSSRSTKLIHGGLRYLKQFHFAEVASVGKERKVLYRNAPHLVFPEKMLLPFYKGGTFGRLSLSLALWIYDLLAGVKNEEKKRLLSPGEVCKAEPLLDTTGLLGAGLYYEYRTDDARLVIDILRTAVAQGLYCINYCEVREFIFEKNTVAGIVAEDILSGKKMQVSASCVVNATGPWADQLTELDNTKRKKILHHTKGVHLVISKQDFPIRQALYFEGPDKRMIFAIPRKEITYIGTTDTDYNGSLEDPQVSVADVNYLLKAVNAVFPSVQLSARHIISSWAGIRPLIEEEGKSPSEISRREEIIISSHGLVTVAGGKLTGYRKMAEEITDIVMKKMCMLKNIPHVSCKTQSILISSPPDFQENDLVKKILYSVNEEGAATLGDFFIRRTGMLYFEREKIAPLLSQVADEMQKLLGWTAEEKQKQLSEFEKVVNSAVHFL